MTQTNHPSHKAASRLASPHARSSGAVQSHQVSPKISSPLSGSPQASSSASRPTDQSSPPRPPSSPHLNRQLLWQSLVLLGAAIGLGLLFVFVFLPLLINITGAAKMASAPTPIELTQPQVPILNTPPEYIAASSLRVTGFGEPDSTIYFVVNGSKKEKNQAIVAANGEFSLNLELTHGANTISAYSLNSHGQESGSSKDYSVIVDQEIPTIELSNLTDGQEIVGKTNQTLEIKGQSEPKIKIYVNDRLTQTNDAGEFVFRTQLATGDNPFQIRAEDNAGNSGETSLTIKFQP